MSKLNLGSITVIVSGFTLNNGLPYFQKAVPAALKSRIGKATIKIRLHERDGHYAVQCHRLDQKYSALFRAMKNDPSIVPSEAKLAALALLETAGIRPADGTEEVRFTRDDGRIEVLNPAKDFLHDFLMERDFQPSVVTRRYQRKGHTSRGRCVRKENHQVIRPTGMKYLSSDMRIICTILRPAIKHGSSS